MEEFRFIIFNKYKKYANTQCHFLPMKSFCELFECVLMELGGTRILLARTYIGNTHVWNAYIKLA